MGNVIITDQFAAPSILAYSAQATGYPASNVLDWWHPRRPWRPGVKTASYLVLDFGSAKTIPYWFIDRANIETIVVQANSANSWTSPLLSKQFSVSLDSLTMRRRVMAATGATTAYQYWRILIPTQDVLDDLSTFSIGRIVPCLTAPAMTQNPDMGLEVSAQEPEPYVNAFASGGTEIVAPSTERIWTCTMKWSSYPTASIADVQRVAAIPAASLLICYLNMGDTSQAYMCTRQKPMSITYDGYETVSTSTIEFKEVL